MEENVALDSNKQKQFVKSIKGIKKLIKKEKTVPKVEKVVEVKVSGKKIKKRQRKERGLVYLSHIPHGFYENEMTQYFKQFGCVTNVRVIRSKRTGNSKGHAFVQFAEPSVAQIVAETMNNYLMGKRLIKAAYVPPEKQKRFALRKHWSATNNPGNDLRMKIRKAHNMNKTDGEELKRARKLLKNLSETKKKLSALGIDYDFFSPVDVPEELLTSEETETPIKKIKPTKVETKKETKSESKSKPKASKPLVLAPKAEKSKSQENKEKKLKKANIKPVENFIKINKDESASDDDSSVNFDSDAFENEDTNFDEEFGSGDESGEVTDDGEDDVESEEISSEEEPTPVKGPIKRNKVNKQPQPLVLRPNPVSDKKSAALAEKKVKVPPQKAPGVKRKVEIDALPKNKKAKFEKKGKQSKLIKKKK